MNAICVQTSAGGQRQEGLAKTGLPYQGKQGPSSGFFRKCPPGRRDRAPAQPPTPAPRPAASADAISLGLLLLLLLVNGDGLTADQSRQAWELAARWATGYVAARHPEAAAHAWGA